MNRQPRHSRTIYGRVGAILGLHVAAAVVAGLVSFARLPGGLPLFVVIVAWLGALLTCTRLNLGTFWSMLGVAITGAVFVFTAFYAVHSSALASRGVTVRATVVDVGRPGRGEYLYQLADPDGRPIQGGLFEMSDDYGVSDQLVVVVDPAGLVRPETAGEVAAARPMWIANGVSFGVTALIALWAARSVPREERAPTIADSSSP